MISPTGNAVDDKATIWENLEVESRNISSLAAQLPIEFYLASREAKEENANHSDQ